MHKNGMVLIIILGLLVIIFLFSLVIAEGIQMQGGAVSLGVARLKAEYLNEAGLIKASYYIFYHKVPSGNQIVFSEGTPPKQVTVTFTDYSSGTAVDRRYGITADTPL